MINNGKQRYVKTLIDKECKKREIKDPEEVRLFSPLVERVVDIA